jgi:hypothetical protein
MRAPVLPSDPVPILDESLTDESVPLVCAQQSEARANAKPKVIADITICFFIAALLINVLHAYDVPSQLLTHRQKGLQQYLLSSATLSRPRRFLPDSDLSLFADASPPNLPADCDLLRFRGLPRSACRHHESGGMRTDSEGCARSPGGDAARLLGRHSL